MAKTTTIQPSGRILDLNNFSASDINIDDIIISLSNIYRFGGGMKWSVAAHSYFCHNLIKDLDIDDPSGNLKMHLLLHDCHEGYTGDVITPLANVLDIGQYIKPIQYKLDVAIYEHLGIEMPDDKEKEGVKYIDAYAANLEIQYICRKNDMSYEKMAEILGNDVKIDPYDNINLEEYNDDATRGFSSRMNILRDQK